jgi:predicted Zn-dependent protease
MTRTYLALAAVALLAAPGYAKDRTGFQAIEAGDLAKAERRIERERKIFPDRPALLINLAAIYRQTGRAGEAQALYRRVLERPAVEMELADGAAASSHDLARAGLARGTQVATR